MRIRTHLKAGAGTKIATNHNEALKVRTTLRAGRGGDGINLSNHNEALKVRTSLKAGGIWENHNEALQVRSALKAGATTKLATNHTETVRRESDRRTISMRRRIPTMTRKADRLELLVVRAGLRAGARRVRRGVRS